MPAKRRKDLELELRTQQQRVLRLNRVHAVLSGVNSAIVRIRERQALLNEACRIAAKEAQFWLAWIGILDQAGRLKVAAVAGDGAKAIADLAPSLSFSPLGVAQRSLSENRTIVDNDISAHPNLDAYRRRVVEEGCRSVIALPLSCEDRLIGTFLFYSPVEGFFDQDEIRLLEEMAGNISYALTFIAQQDRLNYLAYFDGLTHLPNQTLLYDRVDQQLRMQQPWITALVLLDLERFHAINDSFGRQVGDRLLQEVARRLQSSVRSSDTAARVGSDSFAVLMADVGHTADIAYLLRDRILNVFLKPFIAKGQAIPLTAKIGVALAPTDGDRPDVLHSNAEAALERARSGGEQFVFYAPEMNQSVAESLSLEYKLRRALEKEQFVLHYQPKISVLGRSLSGLEALMRWQDPELGLISPAKFIPILEKTGLVLDAGRWVLAQVASDCRNWVQQGFRPPPVAVNVSPIQLRHKDFVDTVLGAAAAAQNVSGQLELEITESVLMDSFDESVHKLQLLRKSA